MRIIVYNSSSFGGCFEYGKAIHAAYAAHAGVENSAWWLPRNAATGDISGVSAFLLPDRLPAGARWLRQIYFLFRTWLNPLLVLKKLQAQPPSTFIFNDFEQLSALLWVPLFRISLKGTHRFAIILHDPDRDAYPPSLRFTRYSMRKIMRLMDVAIYHDYLPEKPYYQNLPGCRFLDLPHGPYHMPGPDPALLSFLEKRVPPGSVVMSIPGNIRKEKNYDLAIEALTSLPQHILIIAGSAANTRISAEVYRDRIRELGLEDRVIWIERFLSEAELAAVVSFSDVIVLNYAISFTSQSGILNVVAPFRKELIASDGPSSLAAVIKKFGVGELVTPGSVSSLTEALIGLQPGREKVRRNWDEYLQYASWKNHADKAIACFRTL
jgi:glycosyltransferase involved in cell wall biosynthesis